MYRQPLCFFACPFFFIIVANSETCYYSQPCKKRSSVNSNTLRDAQIRSILLHIALAAAEGFQLLMN